MGYTLPSSNSPAERARSLIARKDAVEAEIDAQISILKANGATMQTQLVDAEGFPRADMDIWAVRTARVHIIELRNDLSVLMDEIGKALEGVYERTPETEKDAQKETTRGELRPFAKVNGVAPGSPAADAELLRDDLVLKFGHLDYTSFDQSSLQPLAEFVNSSEDKPIMVIVRRESHGIFGLRLTPRQGWGGRGMLGCHIVPYTSP